MANLVLALELVLCPVGPEPYLDRLGDLVDVLRLDDGLQVVLKDL